jgi:hypothetical protein
MEFDNIDLVIFDCDCDCDFDCDGVLIDSEGAVRRLQTGLGSPAVSIG